MIILKAEEEAEYEGEIEYYDEEESTPGKQQISNHDNESE